VRLGHPLRSQAGLRRHGRQLAALSARPPGPLARCLIRPEQRPRRLPSDLLERAPRYSTADRQADRDLLAAQCQFQHAGGAAQRRQCRCSGCVT